MSTLIPLLTDYEKTPASPSGSRCRSAIIGLSDEEMDARIAAARRRLGRRLVILGHHYQRDEVIKFADYTGDSCKLVAQVASRTRTPSSSCSAASTSWPRAPTCWRAAPAGDPARPRAPAARWPTWRDPTSSRSAGSDLDADGQSPASCPSPTSTPRRPSRRSSANTAASSARRRTPRPR